MTHAGVAGKGRGELGPGPMAGRTDPPAVPRTHASVSGTPWESGVGAGMRDKHSPILSVCASLFLAACGGNGSDSSDPSHPRLAVSPTSLDMEAVLGASPIATARFTVSNSGGGTLIWSVSTVVPGVSASPAEGQLDSGGSATVTLTLDCVAGLAPAQQPRVESGTVTVRATGASQAQDISLQIACRRPEIGIDVRSPARADGLVGAVVSGVAEFRFLSPWADQPPLEYEVISGDPRAVLPRGSGEAAIGAWERIELSHRCESETEFAAAVTLRIDGHESNFEWHVACRLAAVDLNVFEPRTAHGTRAGIAGGTVEFLYSRSQQGRSDLPPLAFKVTSDDPDVAAIPSEGVAEESIWHHVDLIHQCNGERSFTARITLRIGDRQREFEWRVVCGLGNAWVHSIEFYQGPIVSSIKFNDNGTWNGGWRAFYPVAERDALVVARIHHSMPTVPEAWAYRVPDTTREREGAGVKPLHGPSTLAPGEERAGGPGDILRAIPRRSYLYESEYAFLFEGGTPAGHYGFEIDVDPQDLVPEGDEADNDRGAAAYWETNPIGPLRIVFVPIEVNGRAPDIETFGGLDALMKDAMDFLPIPRFSARIRATPMVYSGPVPFDMEHAFDQLKQEWLTDENVADGEFYHGLVAIDGFEGGQAAFNEPDALPSFTPVAVSSLSVIQSASTGSRIIAHEIGHNVSLYHAPCNVPDASSVDPHWPETGRWDGTYDNAGIGPDRGYRFSETEFVAPGTEDAHDFMSYCLPGFVSPVSYEAAHDFLLLLDQHLDGEEPISWLAGQGLAPAGAAASQPVSESSSLAISGSVSEFGAWSVFAAQHTPRPPWPRGGGRYTLMLLNGGGTPLGEIGFDPVPLGHGNRQTWSVRIAMPRAAQPARVRITDGQGQAVLDAALVLEAD